MRWYVPTLGRAHRVHTLLRKLPTDRMADVALVVRPYERDAYARVAQQARCALVVLPADLPAGIAPTRQWLLDHGEDRHGMLDDDLRFDTREGERLRSANREDVGNMLTWLEHELQHTPLAGIPSRPANSRKTAVRAQRQYGIHAVDAAAARAHGIRWDRLALMGDFDFVLQWLRQGYANHLCNRWCHDSTPNAAGGCSEERPRRAVPSAIRLAELHAPYVTVVNRPAWRGMQERRLDVRVNWRAAYAEGRARRAALAT